jgi:hypothetical protein
MGIGSLRRYHAARERRETRQEELTQEMHEVLKGNFEDLRTHEDIEQDQEIEEPVPTSPKVSRRK